MKIRSMLKWLALASVAWLALGLPSPVRAAVLINELAPGVNAVSSAEFVELYNTGDSPVDLTNWTLARRTRTGTTDSGVLTLSGTIPAQSYFLITGGTYNDQAILMDPPLPSGDLEDTTGTVVGSLSADNGQIGLKDNTGTLVDAVGYWVGGTFTGDYVETTAKNTGGSFSSRRSLSRDDNHTDTNNNDVDFIYPSTNVISPTNSTGATPTPGPTATPSPTPTPVGGIYPYLTMKNNPSNSIVVNWWNPSATGDSTVDYGPTASYGSTLTIPGSVNMHHVELTGLTPGDTYHYRIRSSDGTTGEDNTFSLPVSKPTSFTFAAFGDTRAIDQPGDSTPYHTRHKAECDHIASKNVDFAVHTGDCVNQGSRVDDWGWYFWAEQNMIKKVPIVISMGNHEVQPGGQPYYYFFDLFAPAFPENGTSGANGRNFSFDYGNAHFVVLSSYQIDMTQQRDWLAADLAAASSNPNIRWKFAIMHAPLYTSANSHPGDTTERSLWGPVFDQYHVDLVFAGHNHIYERTYPIVNQTITSSGTIYLTCGLGGGPYNNESTTVDSAYIQTSHAGETAATYVTINGDSLSAETITASNVVVDSFTLERTHVRDWHQF